MDANYKLDAAEGETAVPWVADDSSQQRAVDRLTTKFWTPISAMRTGAVAIAILGLGILLGALIFGERQQNSGAEIAARVAPVIQTAAASQAEERRAPAPLTSVAAPSTAHVTSNLPGLAQVAVALQTRTQNMTWSPAKQNRAPRVARTEASIPSPQPAPADFSAAFRTDPTKQSVANPEPEQALPGAQSVVPEATTALAAAPLGELAVAPALIPQPAPSQLTLAPAIRLPDLVRTADVPQQVLLPVPVDAGAAVKHLTDSELGGVHQPTSEGAEAVAAGASQPTPKGP